MGENMNHIQRLEAEIKRMDRLESFIEVGFRIMVTALFFGVGFWAGYAVGYLLI